MGLVCMSDWENVERVIRDLKNDGYEVSEFESNTSEPDVEKAFLSARAKGGASCTRYFSAIKSFSQSAIPTDSMPETII